MAYIDQRQDRRVTVAAIAGVGAIHAVLGLGVIAGMTIIGVGPVADAWDPFTLTPQATPTPTVVPPTPDDTKIVVVPPASAPLPPISLPTLSPIESTAVPGPLIDKPSPALVPWPAADPAPAPVPTPSPTFAPRGAAPSNDQARWITTDDYPARQLRDGIQGTVHYRLIIGSNGRVSACEVSRSSGNSALDQASCRLITRRARFAPATDAAGASVPGSYSGTVLWQIPG